MSRTKGLAKEGGGVTKRERRSIAPGAGPIDHLPRRETPTLLDRATFAGGLNVGAFTWVLSSWRIGG